MPGPKRSGRRGYGTRSQSLYSKPHISSRGPQRITAPIFFCNLFAIGAENSSNSKRLVDVALRSGAKAARLIASVDFVDWSWFKGVSTLGITAGASAPEILVDDLINACRERFYVSMEEIRVTDENVIFKLPRVLAV